MGLSLHAWAVKFIALCRNGMDAASWPSGAAADTRVDDVNDVDDEELEDDIEAPRPPAPAPGDPPLDASMPAAASTGALPMSTSAPGNRPSCHVYLLWDALPNKTLLSCRVSAMSSAFFIAALPMTKSAPGNGLAAVIVRSQFL